MYRGRIAPTPTGLLHLGHAATFLVAQQRARAAGGELILRVEDLDAPRCRPEFIQACLEDLEVLGIRCAEGPVFQSQRRAVYLEVWRRLRDGGWIYPCRRSRQDVRRAAQAPHEEDPVFPVAWRTPLEVGLAFESPAGVNWRFRVPDGEEIAFLDGRCGSVRRTAGVDFGDFLVWRRDDVPAYELAVVADDAAMGITEVVRGEDLLTSTARQLLLYRALQSEPPVFFHTPLLRDASGVRLAKRTAALSLRQLRESGTPVREILAQFWRDSSLPLPL